MKIEIEVNIPEEYEATGEYQFPKDGDWYLSQGNKCVALESLGHTDRKALILRKIAQKMRGMNNGEALRILSSPYCIIRRIGSAEWVTPNIHTEFASNYEYGFIREDGSIDGPYKFEKEV